MKDADPVFGCTLYRCIPSVSGNDVQALAEFLRETDGSETKLHRLIEAHPAIVGALGFLEFFSETALTKRGLDNQLIDDRRFRDRPDILAAKLSITTELKSHKLANIIELKGARDSVLTGRGLDRSDALNHALNQLRRYSDWLLEPVNQNALRQYGWDVWKPGKLVVMGSLQNFSNPGQAEKLKQELLQSEGVQLILADELIGLVEATRRRNDGSRLIESFEAIVGFRVDGLASSLILAEGSLAGLVLAKRLLKDAITPYGNVDVRNGLPEGLAHIRELRLQPLASKLQIPFANAVVGFSGARRYGWKPVKWGVVVATFDEAAMLQEIQRRNERNDGARRRREKKKAEEDKRIEEDIRARAVELGQAITQMFPGLSSLEGQTIAQRATLPGSGRIGTNNSFTLAERAWFSVAAYAAYDPLGFRSKRQADSERHRVQDLLTSWGGPNPNSVLRPNLPTREPRKHYARWHYGEDLEDL